MIRPLPPGAYIEDGLIIVGDEAWLPEEWDAEQERIEDKRAALKPSAHSPMVEAIRGHAVRRAYQRKAQTRKCALCGATGADLPVLRFQLVTTERLDTGKATRRSAGGMSLCEPCWRRHGRTREKAIRPDDRRRRHKAAAAALPPPPSTNQPPTDRHASEMRAREMRSMKRAGHTGAEIARHFGISRQRVYQVLRGSGA